MHLKSIGLTLALGAVVSGLSVARAGSNASPPSARVIETAAARELALPAAVVVATPPTISELLDLVLGDGSENAPPSTAFAPRSEESRIAATLRLRTPDAQRANRIAAALIREGRRSGIGANVLVGVLLTEDPDLDPRARSSVGARGLMQVMPLHAGKWGCPSADLFDIESNICHGVRILADNLSHSRDLPTALQRYNGCVSGTNTPDCYLYSGKVYSYARRTAVGPRGTVSAQTAFSRLSPTRIGARARTSRPLGQITIPRDLLVD